MIRWLASFIVFVAALFVGHQLVLDKTPGFIMKKAMTVMKENGAQLHSFTLSARTTPQSQTVVRPSPDLAYSICPFDLSGGQSLLVQAGAYSNYGSVSFFDARTNNFATVRIGPEQTPGARFGVKLHPPGKRAADDNFAGPQIEAPSAKGLILIRRLAPSQAAYDEVAKIAVGDSCGPISG